MFALPGLLLCLNALSSVTMPPETVHHTIRTVKYWPPPPPVQRHTTWTIAEAPPSPWTVGLQLAMVAQVKTAWRFFFKSFRFVIKTTVQDLDDTITEEVSKPRWSCCRNDTAKYVEVGMMAIAKVRSVIPDLVFIKMRGAIPPFVEMFPCLEELVLLLLVLMRKRVSYKRVDVCKAFSVLEGQCQDAINAAQEQCQEDIRVTEEKHTSALNSTFTEFRRLMSEFLRCAYGKQSPRKLKPKEKLMWEEIKRVAGIEENCQTYSSPDPELIELDEAASQSYRQYRIDYARSKLRIALRQAPRSDEIWKMDDVKIRKWFATWVITVSKMLHVCLQRNHSWVRLLLNIYKEKLLQKQQTGILVEALKVAHFARFPCAD